MTLLAPLHTAHGARLAPPGAPLPVLAHGPIPSEYAAATQRWALFDRSNLGSLAMTGVDAAGFLTRILAGDVRRLETGRTDRCLLLSSKGKVTHLFQLARDEAGFLATTPESDAARLAQSLDAYHFGEKIVWQDTSSDWAHFDLVGPEAPARLQAITDGNCPAKLGTHGMAQIGSSEVHLQHIPIAGNPGFRLRVPQAQAADLWQFLVAQGAHPAGLVVFDSLRAEAIWGLWGVDIDDSIYPQEARLEDAFSLTKGCYIGQEVVAKIDTYGGLNKRLMLLAVDSDDPVHSGTRLLSVPETADEPERDLGVVTTWAYSFALDRGVVLAYVKRKHQTVGTRFRLSTEVGADKRWATLVDPSEKLGESAP